ncbi:MAG: purine-nucleoside phosphorylase [Chthoniobacteraceae bacterium]
MKAENEFEETALAAEIRKNHAPEWGIVLGSGLGGFVNEFPELGVLPYGEVPGMPLTTVPGHEGRFVFTKFAGKSIMIAQGRTHLYEGHTARQVATGVRFMAAMGVTKLILTNAAGAINPAFTPGDWMVIGDHINLTGTSPLTGGPNFFDMSEVYSQRLRAHFEKSAVWEKITLHSGVYACVAGPQYETPAEVRMLGKLGADAVGMSTVPEAIQARALGLEVAAFSFLTNHAAGLGSKKLDHDEVLRMAGTGAAGFGRIIARALDTVV